MKLLKNISGILKAKTIAHSAITLTGTALNGILGVFFFVFLARELGPENFGLVSISIIVLSLVADIADSGVNTGLINFIGRHAKEDPARAAKFFKLGLVFKTCVSLVVIIIGVLLAPLIAEKVFLKSNLAPYLALSFIGVGGAMLFSLSSSTLQAYQRYLSWSAMNILSNALRLLVVVILSSLALLSPFNALKVYILLPLLGFGLSLWLLPKGVLKVKNEKSVAKEFFHYNKWVALSIVVAALSSRIDTFFVARLLPVKESGFYSVGVQLSSLMPQFIFAIASVIAPKIASYTGNKALLGYLKKLQLFTLVLAIFGFLASPLAFYFIPLFYGQDYFPAIIPFLFLFYAQLIFLLAVPAHQTIFYYFSNPKIFVLISFIILLIMSLSNLLLVPVYGILGAAASVLLGTILNFLIPAAYVLKRLKSDG